MWTICMVNRNSISVWFLDSQFIYKVCWTGAGTYTDHFLTGTPTCTRLVQWNNTYIWKQETYYGFLINGSNLWSAIPFLGIVIIHIETILLLCIVMKYGFFIVEHSHISIRTPGGYSVYTGICIFACLLGCIFMKFGMSMGGFPSLTHCTQFAKLGVFWQILPNKHPIWPTLSAAENGILKGPNIVLLSIANSDFRITADTSTYKIWESTPTLVHTIL